MTSTTTRPGPPTVETCPMIAAHAELIQAVRTQAAAVHQMFMSTIGAALQACPTTDLTNTGS